MLGRMMSRVILLAEITSILECGNFDQLIGGVEDEHLECKGGHYQLQQDTGKMELAKDVSALANANGGIILIGVTTERDQTRQEDIIRHCGCFAENSISFRQCEDVISEWVLPSVPGLKFKWHPSATNPSDGIASIFIPSEACHEKPFLVGKVVVDTGKIVGSYIGYFERKRDRVPPMKSAELRERLKDGLRFAELNTRLMNVEEMVGTIVARDQPPPHQTGLIKMSPALLPEVIVRRVQRAREEVGFASRPTFSLVAWPDVPIDFPSLFESREDPVVQTLEHPPELRNGGFGLLRGRPSVIVEGKLRRCIAPGYRLLEVWRDGPVLSVSEGNGDHLCWGMNSTDETGLQINNLALTETVYLFCDWALDIYKSAKGKPTQLNFRMMFSDMAPGGRPFRLNSAPAGTFEFRYFDGGRPAPDPAGQHFEITTDFTSAEPGVIAYQLLFDLYTWFGFESSQVPYVNRNKLPARIDPDLIILRASLVMIQTGPPLSSEGLFLRGECNPLYASRNLTASSQTDLELVLFGKQL
jgi:hypothetical protein